MTSLPYPSFEGSPPSQALAAVGRCRIRPATYADTLEQYRTIVSKTQLEAEAALAVDDASDDESKKKEQKKLQKQFMKQAVALAKDYLMQLLKLDVAMVDVEVVVPTADWTSTHGCLATCWLDAGSQTVVLDGHNPPPAEFVAIVPSERVAVHVTYNSQDSSQSLEVLQQAVARDDCSSCSIGVASEKEKVSRDIESVLESLKSNDDAGDMPVTIQLRPNDYDLAASDDESTGTDLTSVVQATLANEHARHSVALLNPTAEQLATSVVACMRTDRTDGLFTTVVCTRSNEALGLVYSSRESIQAALECGRGVYYSRSRQSLWRKGDSSGAYQILHRLDVDCDGDALRVTVTQCTSHEDQPAAFCHLNTLTCWGPPRGLRHLEQTLQDRRRSAPEGSYTKRLFNDDDLLRDKLVEEAQELSEATDQQHVAEELADVLYFAMTRAVKAGVTLEDAVAELDRRSRKVTRRKGDSKAFRVAAGQAILEKSQEKGAEG